MRARGRAAKRLEAARAREALAIEAAAKAQTQRDELASWWRTWKQRSGPLSAFPMRSTRSRRAAAARDEPAVPRSPPAKGGLPKVRPDESDDSDESVRADSAKGIGRSSAGSDGDGEDDDGGSGSDSAKSTAARKRRPNGRRAGQGATRTWLASCSSWTTLMRSSTLIAHGRPRDAEVSSDDTGDADDPAGALARGGARSLELGSRQAERLERRLRKHHDTVSSPSRAPAVAASNGTPIGSARGSRKVAAAERSASDDELTLGGSMSTPAAAGRLGPHAALSGITQRTASAVFGAVRHLAGGAAAAESPDSFVGVDVDDHDCKARGMRTRSHGSTSPAGSPDAVEGPSSGSELDLPGCPPVTRAPSTRSSATARGAASAGRGPGRSGAQAAGSSPSVRPPASPPDTRAGAPGGGGGLADGAEVSLALRTVLAAERANDLSVQQLRMQHETSQRALKSEKDASSRHDTHDMKVLRMLVNDCSASYTPPVAESESPSADTRMLTSQWLPTVKRRVADAVTRAEMYGILFVPTSRILKYPAKYRFGRNGLHPDLFKTYTFENASTMAPLDADVDALDKPLTSNDLSDTLVVLDERCEQMVNWVEKVLSRNLASRLLEFFEWGSRSVKHDRKGLWALTDWKGLILDVLDEVTRHIDVQLDLCKSLCEGAVDEDAFFPSLAKVRMVAMTKQPDGSRSVQPAWVPLILADMVDASSGVVTVVSKVAALRAKQLEATEYERNRAGAMARAAVKKRALERSL